MDIRACRDEGCRSRIGAGKAEHFVPRGEQFIDDGRANESTCTGNKYTHGETLIYWMEATLGASSIGVK